MIALGVWTEKKPNKGEDAEPRRQPQRVGPGMLAVFDGVGGAGVQTAGRTANGTERSGAWVSSRAVRLAMEQYFLHVVRYNSADATPDEHLAAAPPRKLSVHEHVNGVLQELRNPVRSRIVGTMQRELPSTLAAVLDEVQPPWLKFQVRWAGDSRCYLLSPPAGLQQLSRDDTETLDALSSLEQDPPMTNQISADGQYRIQEPARSGQLCRALPVATDGFFSYVQTPAHFEYILLQSLDEATEPAGWARFLASKVQEYTQDDASLALVAFGYSGFSELQAAFHERTSWLREEHWQPFERLGDADDEAYRALRLDSWRRYKAGLRAPYLAGGAADMKQGDQLDGYTVLTRGPPTPAAANARGRLPDETAKNFIKEFRDPSGRLIHRPETSRASSGAAKNA